MNWKLFAVTFISIFLAELGDKTQLATMGFAAQNANAKWIIFGASAAALTLTSLLGVVFGGVISNYVSPQYIKIGSAILFFVIGIYLAWDSISDFRMKKYEKIVTYVTEKAGTDCIACVKFQQALSQVREQSVVSDFIKEPGHEENGCANCSAAHLCSLISQVEGKGDEKPAQNPEGDTTRTN